jgi:hypothetical protein
LVVTHVSKAHIETHAAVPRHKNNNREDINQGVPKGNPIAIQKKMPESRLQVYMPMLLHDALQSSKPAGFGRPLLFTQDVFLLFAYILSTACGIN